MPHEIKCDNCGKSFYKYKSQLNGKKHFCSIGCNGEYYANQRTTGKYVKCSNCRKKIYRPLGELKKHEKFFCSNKCQGKWQTKNYNKEKHPAWKKRKREMTCDYCGKKVYKTPNKIMGHLFCSHECFGKFCCNKNHPFWKGGLVEITCMVCNKKFKVKKNRIRKNVRFCSIKCRSKYIKGQNHPMWGKKSAFSYLNKKKSFQKKRLKSLLKKPTCPEQRIINIIEKYNLPFKYVGDGSFILHNLNPDFIRDDNKKQIIEIFGIAFHTSDIREIKWNRTEFGRKAIFSQLGYDTLILWDTQIKNMADEEIAKKIKSFC